MKTREYEFEGVKYRWLLTHNEILWHQRQDSDGVWHLPYIPPTPAAASALAALIEDMQVQVTAEWRTGAIQWRAREAEHGPIVEFRWSDRDVWVDGADIDEAVHFRAGYEAGKAAR